LKIGEKGDEKDEKDIVFGIVLLGCCPGGGTGEAIGDIAHK